MPLGTGRLSVVHHVCVRGSTFPLPQRGLFASVRDKLARVAMKDRKQD